MWITAHFFGQKDHKRHHVTLAVRRFLHPHIGEYVWKVVQEVLAEWNIPLANVFAILTENGLKYAQSMRMTRATVTRRRRMHMRRRKGTGRTKMWRRVPRRRSHRYL